MQAIAIQVTPETMEDAADAAMVAAINGRITQASEINTDLVRELFDMIVQQRGPNLYEFTDEQSECTAFRMDHFTDSERQQSEFWATVYSYSEAKCIPDGFDFECEPGLFVHYEQLQKWPTIRDSDGFSPIELSAFGKTFSDGTSSRVVTIEAGPVELTYETAHQLIDFLQEAARLLVAAPDSSTTTFNAEQIAQISSAIASVGIVQ